jgi:hypothetical protein
VQGAKIGWRNEAFTIFLSMPLASENERHGTRDTGIDGGFLSVRIYSAKNRKAWFLPSRNFSVGQSPTLQRLTKLDGASPNAPKKKKNFGNAGGHIS